MVQPRFRYLIFLYRIVPSFGSIIKLGRWTRSKSRTRLTAGVEQDDLFALFRGAKDKKTDRTYTEDRIWTESVLLLAAGKFIILFVGARG